MARRVTIEITRKTSRIVGEVSDKIVKALDTAFSYAVEGAFFMRRNRPNRGWSGKTHLFQKRTRTFRNGLLTKVCALLETLGVKYNIDDRRERKTFSTKNLSPDILHGVSMSGVYSYQIDAIKKALRKRSGVLWMATNAGKTNVIAGVCQSMSEYRTLIIVPNKKKLARDTRMSIAKLLGVKQERIGYIGEGVFSPANLTVAMVGGLAPRRLARDAVVGEYLKSVDLLIVDECHHVKAPQYRKVLRRINPLYVYGMSGTPYNGKADDLFVEAVFGPMIVRMTNAELIKLGVSAVCTVHMRLIDEPEIRGGSFAEVYSEGIVNNLSRNARIAQDVANDYKKGLPSLVMVREKAHGNALSGMLKSKKVPHKFVYSTGFPGGLKAIEYFFRAFEEHKLPVLIVTTGLMDEGLNVHSIRVLTIADAFKSSRLLLQKVGRALRRKKDGSNTVLIRDYADATNTWLADHALQRLQIYEAEGFKIRER